MRWHGRDPAILAAARSPDLGLALDDYLAADPTRALAIAADAHLAGVEKVRELEVRSGKPATGSGITVRMLPAVPPGLHRQHNRSRRL